MARFGSPPRMIVLALMLCLSGEEVLSAKSELTEMWVCSRPGQADLYTNHEYPGCRRMGEAKTYSPLATSPKPLALQSKIAPPPISKDTVADSFHESQQRKPLPFADVTLPLPLVAVSQPTQGFITGSWTGHVAQLSVGYKADGKGPEILGDANLLFASLHSFQTAVAVATKAVGFDPRYLTVRILIPTRMNGPSAGGMFAVGIAAALLGDSIKPDVCMSGTIEPDAEIRPVGRLVDKMNACRDLRRTTMIVPDGLDNSHLNFTGLERSIRVIEVHTLAEAYNAATGQLLRRAISQ